MSESDDIESIRERKLQELMDESPTTADATTADEANTAVATGPDEPIHIDRPEELQTVADEYDVVLVDFHADWCGPCQMLEPIVKQIAATTSAAVAKVDIDALPSLAQQHQVRGVPTLIVYAGGEPRERMVGVQDEASLRSVVERFA